MSNKEERMNRNKSIIEDYKNGKPILEIAREYNLSETMCYKILKGTQEPPRYFEKKRKRLTTRNEQIVKQYVEYSCWAWTSVRPLDDDKDTHFAKRNSALSRLHYSNRSMYSLLSFHYLFGVDFKPDYQRGSVWDEQDREKLLDSIFAGREIGRFVFKQLPFNRTNDDGNYYEIVDGKQRLLTLLAFYENRFPYKGVFYNDLSVLDKNWFMDASIGIAELDQNATRAEVLEVFLALNEGGKPVAKEVLDHARELLNEEKGEGLCVLCSSKRSV